MAQAQGYSGEQRILVYGVTGSGKTTFAENLSHVLGIPWHSVDDLTWEPGWVVVAPQVQRDRITAICSQPTWILDTAYKSWLDVPFASTELIIALDYPRWFSLARLFRRTISRLFDRKTICNGNRESLRSMLSRDSILVWHFRSYTNKHARIQSWVGDHSAPPVLVFSTPSQATHFLSTITTASR